MKQRLGFAFELTGAGLLSYALYSVAPWAGLVAGGLFTILIGISLGAAK